MTNPDDNQQIPQEELLSQISKFPPDLIAALFQNQGQPFDTGKPNAINARGSWTQQEDEMLKSAISQLGSKKWSDIARFVPTRTSKQCRERWYNRLSPELKHGPFEQWEDQIIIEKQKEVGNRWSVIAQLLPGRSPGAIKNRWHSGLKGSASFSMQNGDSLNPQQTDAQLAPFPIIVPRDDQQQTDGQMNYQDSLHQHQSDGQLYNGEL